MELMRKQLSNFLHRLLFHSCAMMFTGEHADQVRVCSRHVGERGVAGNGVSANCCLLVVLISENTKHNVQ